jgi:hypothetical protein
MHGRSRRARSLTVVGRRLTESAALQAQQEVTVARGSDSRAEFKDSNAGWNARVFAAHDQLG